MFIKNEEQNFSLFSYLNEQAGEIERLEDEIQSLQEEKAQYEKANANNTAQNDEILKIENRIKTTEEQTAMYETKVDAHKKILDRVKDEIKVSMLQWHIAGDECNSFALWSNIQPFGSFSWCGWTAK